jgi:hypothetical protein
MLTALHSRRRLQLGIGFFAGIGFGFFLQKGGVADYNVIIDQLLLRDFRVLKVMVTAVVTGMIGIYALRAAGLARLHTKDGSLGTTVPGPLLFGLGFGALGYCPGTSVAAVGHGALDALIGGIFGIMLGAAFYAAVYPRLRSILRRGDFGDLTLPQALRTSPWLVIVPVAAILIGALALLEQAGL